MLVRINGKEVEVGPGREHKKDCGCIGKIFQKIAERANHQKSRLIINGHEVDMDNPDDVQEAIYYCRIIGFTILFIGIGFLSVACQDADWVNLSSGVLGGLMASSIWVVLGAILAIFPPRILEKRLQELKKQGKIPSECKK